MSDLQTLQPEQHVKTSQGIIEVSPFRFKDFKKVLELVSKYFEIFSTAENANAIVTQLMSSGSEDTLNDIGQLIHWATGQDPNFLDALYWNEVANLLVTIIEQNIDFFFQIGDRLNKIGSDRNPKTQQVGQKPVLDSSNTVTDGMKSSDTPSPSSIPS